MPVVGSGIGGQQSCFDKIRLGFVMGAAIGGSIGLLLGGFGGFRMGLRGSELLKQVGKTAAQSGGSFGVFMSVAQGIRC
uniref:Reactive oxygen species modulator 1 n=1 Tax=Strongyloides stercoralis TaxID=6248 RepID=A0A0K0DUH6_STRER